MTRARLLPALALALAAGGAVAAFAAPATADGRTTLATTLTGAQEVGTVGDPDGRANGVVRIDTLSDEICVVINAQRVEELTLAHVHRGGPEVSGPVVVDLTPLQQDPNSFRGCTTDPDADAVAASPAGFYLNVHNATYPAGALRGNLG